MRSSRTVSDPRCDDRDTRCVPARTLWPRQLSYRIPTSVLESDGTTLRTVWRSSSRSRNSRSGRHWHSRAPCIAGVGALRDPRQQRQCHHGARASLAGCSGARRATRHALRISGSSREVACHSLRRRRRLSTPRRVRCQGIACNALPAGQAWTRPPCRT